MNENLKLPVMSFILSALLISIVPSCLFAQKTEADLQALLIDKPLYLRGQWGGGKLAFDGAGHLRGTAAPVAFTLAGVEIGSVKLTSKGLVLGGQRVGLEFTKDVPRRVGLVWPNTSGSTSVDEITIKIETPSDGDFKTALDAILTGSITGLDAPMPWYWQQYLREHLILAGTLAANETTVPAPVSSGDTLSAGAAIRKVGGSVSAPRVLKRVDPGVNGTASALKYFSALKYSGNTSITFVVEKNGTPSHIRVLHALGLGLDELAVAAISQWTFQPAMENGSAVPVQMNIDISFQFS